MGIYIYICIYIYIFGHIYIYIYICIFICTDMCTKNLALPPFSPSKHHPHCRLRSGPGSPRLRAALGLLGGRDGGGAGSQAAGQREAVELWDMGNVKSCFILFYNVEYGIKNAVLDVIVHDI